MVADYNLIMITIIVAVLIGLGLRALFRKVDKK